MCVSEEKSEEMDVRQSGWINESFDNCQRWKTTTFMRKFVTHKVAWYIYTHSVTTEYYVCNRVGYLLLRSCGFTASGPNGNHVRRATLHTYPGLLERIDSS